MRRTASRTRGAAASSQWWSRRLKRGRPFFVDIVRQGIALFNERRFYEQHEVIEHEWHAERGPIRRLYQGILQVGVGFYHALNGNQKGAVLLLTDGVEKLSAAVPSSPDDVERAMAAGRAANPAPRP